MNPARITQEHNIRAKDENISSILMDDDMVLR